VAGAVLVDARGVGVARPDRPLFADLSITVHSGDRWGVVGINGGGKSTLLRVLAGSVTPDTGSVTRGRGIRINVLDQDGSLPDGTVRSVVSAVEGAEVWEAEAVLDRLGMGAFVDADVRTLSGGQAKRVALARAIVVDCDLLILDEPTNHLDLDAIAWLEERLAAFRGGLILVTHDRHVLDRVCTRTLELDRGKSYIHEGGYQVYLDGRAEREERYAAEESTRRNLARTELAWLRRGAPARTSKSKARIDSATALIERKIDGPARSGSLDLSAASERSGEGVRKQSSGSFRQQLDESAAPRLGNKVIELHGVGHRFGDDAPWLFEKVEWKLGPGERWGIVGPNGAGKTTLLEILAGRLTPAEGSVDVGPTVRVRLSDQLGRALDPNQRVRDAVAGPTRPPGTPEDKKLMEQFWFDDDVQFAQIHTLSGGERRRLQLLLVLAERPNVLLLDEPTNDLDLDTLRVLEDFAEDWPGALVVVSHDRTFLDRVVEDVLMLENGRAKPVLGGYAGWIAQRAKTGASSSGSKMNVLVGSSAAVPTQEAPKAAAPVAAAPEKTRRSPSTLRFLMKEADRELGRATKRRDALTVELESVAPTDYVSLARIGEQMGEAQANIDKWEEAWLELAEESHGE
jgi:ABC transport system ATP-binding/permease protein